MSGKKIRLIIYLNKDMHINRQNKNKNQAYRHMHTTMCKPLNYDTSHVQICEEKLVGCRRQKKHVQISRGKQRESWRVNTAKERCETDLGIIVTGTTWRRRQMQGFAEADWSYCCPARGMRSRTLKAAGQQDNSWYLQCTPSEPANCLFLYSAELTHAVWQSNQ